MICLRLMIQSNYYDVTLMTLSDDFISSVHFRDKSLLKERCMSLFWEEIELLISVQQLLFLLLVFSLVACWVGGDSGSTTAVCSPTFRRMGDAGEGLLSLLRWWQSCKLQKKKKIYGRDLTKNAFTSLN